ncbi:MAG: ROK family protein [Anaerolineae bacterium]|nr:ROK family protein [Anaerolineae bacterium]
MAALVGIDLGGTQIRAVLAEADGTILARYRTRTAPEDGPEAVMGRIVAAAQTVVQQAGGQRPAGVGVGSPGPLNAWDGVVLAAPNLGWSNVPLKATLESRLGLPIVVGNDANAAALAERRFGAGRGVDDLVYVTVSTGIGGGIISGGRLLLGRHGFAGEIGHAAVEARGALCKCGNSGCLETLASGPAIARAAAARVAAGEPSLIASLVGGDLDLVTAETVAAAAREGDQLATEVLRSAAFYIGVALVNLIHILEPELILIGGGVAHVGDLLFNTIRSVVRQRAIPCMAEHVRIEPAALGDDAGVLGAIALFLEYGRA